jgi:hypothetical protein
MRNDRPDGKSLRTLLEEALAPSLAARTLTVVPPLRPAASLDETAVVPRTPEPTELAPGGVPSTPASGSPVVVGEVVDTHHPHLPGRVLVRWLAQAEGERSEWLHHERHLTLGRGDRVLLTLPLGWAEWLVTGALGRAITAASASADNENAAPSPLEPVPASTLRLEPGQSVSIIGHDGQPLLSVRQTEDGLCLELNRDEIELKARRRLRLSADSIEIAAGPGGVDVRTEGDAVTRARAIRLN